MAEPDELYEIRVRGERKAPLRDFYHALLRMSWSATFAVITAMFLVVNALFSLWYLALGGIAHAREDSIVDAFFFSVQTMGTIGYGAMYPESVAANVLVTLESVVGVILTALVTGLVFAKFSRPTARVIFTKQAVISPMNGIPTLSFRVSNERGNQIVDAQIRVHVVRTERNAEGDIFYRMLDLKLTRERALSIQRSWSVQHVIDEHSPLYELTPRALAEQELELHVLIMGLDDTVMQPIHAAHRYFASEIVWGARHADILSDDGRTLTLDLSKFHELEATPASDAFPYSHVEKSV